MPLPKPRIQELLAKNATHRCPEGRACVRIQAIADLPTRYGDFQIVAFDSPQDGKDHAALVRGDVLGKKNVPVRLHSECLTGDAFTSLRCDCREQLEKAMEQIGAMEEGIVLYLRQEGRGIGFSNKIKAYQLQEAGYDTNEANVALGFREDERDYEIAAHMLKSLQVGSIKLLSNNPDKIADLRRHGITVESRIPIVIKPNRHNERYLETKRVESGHLLPAPSRYRVHEQVDNASHEDAEEDGGH